MVDENTKQVRLCDLRTNSCRWPLGECWEHVEFFCGEPTVPGSSWCKEHGERVFSRAVVRGTPMALKRISPLPEKRITQEKPGSRPGRETGGHKGSAGSKECLSSGERAAGLTVRPRNSPSG
jgi:GcrA cell cycle regulator